MKKYLLLFSVMVFALSSCKKETYDPAKQNEKDDAAIKAYLKANNITAQKDESTGMYYKIVTPGSDEHPSFSSQLIDISYVGTRLKDGSNFGQNDDYRISSLGDEIHAWQYGIPKIGRGGEIILYCPSIIVYGNNTVTLTPEGRTDFIEPNTVAIFDIKVLSFF